MVRSGFGSGRNVVEAFEMISSLGSVSFSGIKGFENSFDGAKDLLIIIEKRKKRGKHTRKEREMKK